MLRLVSWLWTVYFAEPLRKVEAESLAYSLSDASRRPDWKTMTVLVAAAASLALQNYTSSPDRLIPVTRFVVGQVAGADAAREPVETLHAWGADRVSGGLWWCLSTAITYTLVPVLLIKFAFQERLGDYGLKIRGAIEAWPIYAIFIAVMAPLVFIFSAEERFRFYYPMLGFENGQQVRDHLWKWELGYAVQFVALEFFFRGFMVHGTKHRFGVYSVFVMTVPYCMIHFGKPIPECAASIIAGIVLGVMSLTTRSVWLGAGIHIAVAWSMDLACLARRGLLG